jgi:hypothetical protein
MAAPKRRMSKLVKVTDEVAAISCVSGDGLIREEVWKDETGRVARYNLAFINRHFFREITGEYWGTTRPMAGRIVTMQAPSTRLRRRPTSLSVSALLLR